MGLVEIRVAATLYTIMKRNENRTWYDKGYSDGTQDAKKDSKIPKGIGITCLCALLIADQYWILAIVFMWLLFDLEEWWDLNKHHESDPPEQWE